MGEHGCRWRALRTRRGRIPYRLRPGVFSRAAFDVVLADEPYDLASLYQILVGRNELAAYEVGQRLYEIGSLEGLAETRRYVGARAEGAS